jgi:hypothetical protein
VRWTRTLDLPAGLYRFATVTDDGVRLIVNGRLLINQWHTQTNQTHTAEFNHPGGNLQLKMEYYDDIGLAQAQLNWEMVGEYTAVSPSPSTPAWRGEYFNNTLLIGEPDLVRQDPAINFNWGFASPDELYLPRSAFSVRWTGTLELPAGNYRFTTSTDDGVRLWVNDQLIINKWRNQAELAFSAEIELPAGRIPVKMEYFNAENQATAHLSWERLDGPLPENVLVGPEGVAGAGGGGLDAPVNLPQAVYAPEIALTGQTSTNILFGPLNVRAEPNLLADVLGKLLDSDDVAVYGRNQFNNWVLVQLADGRFGWISRLYTDLPYDISDLPDVSLSWQPAPTANLANGPVTVTRSSFLAKLYPQPNILSEPITTLPEAEPVAVSGRNHFSTWVKVRLNDGAEGWVSILYIAADFAINSLPDLEG